MTPARLARPPWSDLVLVCKKCLRKAGAKSFRKDLKVALKQAGGGRTFRVVETGCLDICPKGRIVLAGSGTLSQGRTVVANPADVTGAAALLAEPRTDASVTRLLSIDTTDRQP